MWPTTRQANSLIVGNSLRPISDALRISREKLAFLVDATSAPIASVAPVSSWIGFELGLIAASFRTIGFERAAYVAFLQTLPMRFYPINMLVFSLALLLLGRDFGPMHRAEKRARLHGQLVSPDSAPVNSEFNDASLLPKEGIPHRWYNALVPIVAVIVTVVLGLVLDGYFALQAAGWPERPSLIAFFSHSNSYNALIWASLAGLLVQMAMLKTQGIMGCAETLQASRARSTVGR